MPGFTVLLAQMTLSDPVMSENTDLVAADRMMESQAKLRSLTFNLRLWLPVLVALVMILFLARFITLGRQRMLLNANSAMGDQNAYLQHAVG